MAEDNNKPKATLIKHKREDIPKSNPADESQDKKRVRVVVKKKPVPRTVVENDTGNRVSEEPSGTAPQEQSVAQPQQTAEVDRTVKSSVEQQSAEPAATEQSHHKPPTGKTEAATPSVREEPRAAVPEAESGEGSPKESVPHRTEKKLEDAPSGDRPVWTPEGNRVVRSTAVRHTPGVLPQSIRERARAGENVGLRNGGRAEREAPPPPPRPASDYRGGRSPDAPRTDRPDAPRSYRTTTGPARTDIGQRPSGTPYTSGPRTGGAPYGNGPRQSGGPYNSGPRTGGAPYGGAPYGGGPRTGGAPYNSGPRTGARPGMPPRPGAPRPGAPRSGAEGGTDEKKSVGKKFFKAKKKETYQKRERHQEKFIQVKQKKLSPKANPVPKQIDIMEVITVSELARKMNLKASDLIGKLMSMGMMVTINQQIDAETAGVLAGEYDCKVNIVSLYDETLIETPTDREEDLASRPPIVTVMGHVDHGKTKLLDAIRSTDVVSGEFGGITQHIGAYQVQIPNRGKITFLDTPGHEAFSLMRARGAQITDIVILVVAANDGVMPQTVEAINHAKEAKVPIVVAVNKIDLPESNIERVKQQLSEYGLMPEEWGGQTLFCEVSALKKQGISELLETIMLQAEILELRANYDCAAEGKVIESRIDPGRGTVASVLIQRGTLHIGDSYVSGIFPGKVRAMFNDRGERIESAPPSTPVEVLGFTGIPDAGDPFQVTETERVARQIGDKRQELKKVEEAKNVKKITLDNLYDSIKEGGIQELKVVIKGDVHGSVEALQSSLEKLSTKEIRLSVIHAGAGAINEGDVRLAAASNAIIIGFHVRPSTAAQQIADREKVEIRKYNIIYDVVEDIRSAMEGLLAPVLKEEIIGTVEVRETFKVPKIGLIAGCMVKTGKVRRGANIRVIRESVELFSGNISSLRRFKDDAREVDAGYECGIGIENFTDIKVGDEFEIYEIRQTARKLEETQVNGKV